MQMFKLTWHLRLLGNRKCSYSDNVQVENLKTLEDFIKSDGTIEYLTELLSDTLNLPVVGIDDVIVHIDF